MCKKNKNQKRLNILIPQYQSFSQKTQAINNLCNFLKYSNLMLTTRKMFEFLPKFVK